MTYEIDACDESWDDMVPNGPGRHCAACQKTVIDGTRMAEKEFSKLIETSKGMPCVRLIWKTGEGPVFRQEPRRRRGPGLVLLTAMAACGTPETEPHATVGTLVAEEQLVDEASVDDVQNDEASVDGVQNDEVAVRPLLGEVGHVPREPEQEHHPDGSSEPGAEPESGSSGKPESSQSGQGDVPCDTNEVAQEVPCDGPQQSEADGLRPVVGAIRAPEPRESPAEESRHPSRSNGLFHLDRFNVE